MKKFAAVILLLSLCLSMWGCSSNATKTNPTNNPGRPNSSTSNQKPGSNKDNTTSTSIDPNGFSSLEQLVGVYVAMQTGDITKEQFYKLYPEKYWGQYADLDQLYSEYLTSTSNTKESLKKQYGTNYKITYKISNSEIITDYSKKDISDSDNQEFIEMYGVDLKKRCDYHITISITISGSITEYTTYASVYCKQIGSKWYG